MYTFNIIIYTIGPKSHRPSSIGEPVLGPKFALTIYPMEIWTFEVSAKYS